MRLAVTVEPPEQFKAWYAHQLAEATEPKSERAQRGEQIVLTGTCVICHTIQGTTARGTVGPDLTHLMSRQWIGAGALPNDRGSLAAWILDPQAPKPGNLMPPHNFSSADLNALLDYLETLH
jgi:cytochrome c oxidase subunit 2